MVRKTELRISTYGLAKVAHATGARKRGGLPKKKELLSNSPNFGISVKLTNPFISKKDTKKPYLKRPFLGRESIF